MELADEISKNNLMLITTTKGNYQNAISEMYSGLNKSSLKIGYITINKPVNTIIALFEKNNIPKDKFFFVDAITATVETPPPVENCIFVNSPTALTDIGLEFSSLYTDKSCELVFFDTISTLSVYQDPGSVLKFVHNLVTKARVINKKAIFVALIEDSENLIKDLNMFVDKIISL